MGHWVFDFVSRGASSLASLPMQGWLVLVINALVLLALWSAMQWLGDFIERRRFKPSDYSVKKSPDDYVLLSEDDWPARAVSKEANVLIRHRTARGVQATKQTIRYTKDTNFPKGTVGLPSRAIDDLGLDFDTVLDHCDLEITRTQRFIGEALWNHADPSIRISTQTTFWVTTFTTVFSTVAGIVTTLAFR